MGFFLDNLIQFADNPNYYLLPFLGNSQGFHWWYLLISPQTSEYCVLYNAYSDKESIELHNDDELTNEYIVVSQSFDEFLVRASADIIENEEEW